MRRLGKADEVIIDVSGFVNIYGMDRSSRFDFIPACPSFWVPCPDGKACMERTEGHEDICRHCNILYNFRDRIGFDNIESIFRL